MSSLLDQVDSGTMLLPEFQRGYVWNRDQVRGLMRSLYRGYPVGALLIWETEPSAFDVRGPAAPHGGVKQLLLDGQQRITTLYGVARGKPPAFFEGDANAFTGLRFNLDTEVFEFYAPSKMKDDPLWIDVTGVFDKGLAPHIARLNADPATTANFATYVDRINRLQSIRDRDFHAEKITGAEMTIDHVVDIFNKVNSGGTKLSKGDLALAKICADWPQARTQLRQRLTTWQDAGYNFTLDWLLRNVNAVATGRAQFDQLDSVASADFAKALDQATEYVGGFLDLAAGRLGLDHDRVLMGRYAISVISRMQHLFGGLGDAATQNRILYWYIHAGLWGRFTGSTETVLARDYEIGQTHGIDGLIDELERWRGGNLRVGPHDFNAFGMGSRFYPLLYLMTRVLRARDLGNGIELKKQMLGHLSALQVHHIFPKAQLYERGYSRGEVNSVSNFCFLTTASNLAISSRRPQEYLPEIERDHPGALASQWIPQDPQLWRLDRYSDFLKERQRLLADAANEFLDGLRAASTTGTHETLPRITVADTASDDDELTAVRALCDELVARGMATPNMDVEIVDPTTGQAVAVAEAFWEQGLQVGQGQPVVLELDPDPVGMTRMEELGFNVFTSVDALRNFAQRRGQEASGEGVDDPVTPSEDRPAEAGPTADDMPDEKAIRAQFGNAMRDVYVRSKKEAGYTASGFLGMLQRHGALETARRLLAAPHISDGYTALYEVGRLDLTVENVVLQPEFESLFSDEERETAQRRLAEFDFTPKR
nr:DUF262 domain-containing protein [Kineosphaera limosa]